jgi:flagellar biosynthesis/type III secretory pathway protein FliH
MNYEEKRELRLQISQMLADAGLNQKTIKEMVEVEIRNKVNRGVEQAMNSLNSECYSGDYCKEKIQDLLRNTYLNQQAFDRVVREELKNRVIKVVMSNVENESVDS